MKLDDAKRYLEIWRSLAGEDDAGPGIMAWLIEELNQARAVPPCSRCIECIPGSVGTDSLWFCMIGKFPTAFWDALYGELSDREPAMAKENS